MNIHIFLDVADVNCFRDTVPSHAIAAAAIDRTATYYGRIPASGEVVVTCDEPEAMDLLAYAGSHCSESFSKVREAIRKANFQL